MNGLVWHRVGNIIKHEGAEFIVDYVNDCRARCVESTKRTVVVNFRFKGPKTMTAPARTVNISPMTEPGYVLRYEPLSPVLKRGEEKRKQQNKEKEEEMKTAKTAKTPKTPKAPKPHGGKLGEIFGHAVTAVMRRLGAEGCSAAWVRNILKAQGIKHSDATLSIQVNAGRNKIKERGEPADLTQAQVKELKASAVDPAITKAQEEKEAEEKAAEAKKQAAAAKKEKEAVAAK